MNENFAAKKTYHLGHTIAGSKKYDRRQKMKTIISIIMTAALLLSALTGCASSRNTMRDEARVNPTTAPAPTATARPAATAAPGDNAAERTGSVIGNAADRAGSAVGNAAQNAGDAAGDVVEGIGDTVGEAARDAGNAVNELVDDMAQPENGRVTDNGKTSSVSGR